MNLRLNLDERLFGVTRLSQAELYTTLAEGQTLVEQRLYQGKDASDLVVLLPAWHNGEPAYSRFAERLSQSGKDVCAFYLADCIFSANVASTHDYLLEAGQIVTRNAEALQAGKRYHKTVVVGSSLGCTVAMLAIASGLSFDKLVLLTPGDDFAQTAWEGVRTQHLREAYKQQGLDLQSLKAKWADVAPVSNVAKTAGKQVDVYLSKADNVIPYKRGLELVGALRDAGATVAVRTNRHLGHYATIGRYYYFGRP